MHSITIVKWKIIVIIMIFIMFNVTSLTKHNIIQTNIWITEETNDANNELFVPVKAKLLFKSSETTYIFKYYNYLFEYIYDNNTWYCGIRLHESYPNMIENNYYTIYRNNITCGGHFNNTKISFFTPTTIELCFCRLCEFIIIFGSLFIWIVLYGTVIISGFIG